MKTIRFIAVGLLLLTGVLHLLPIIKTPSDPNAVPMMAFGLVYFTLGVMLLLKVKYSELAGIIFPVIGLGTGFFVVGVNNWDAMLTFLFVIDAVVIVCCVLLLLNKRAVN